MTVSQQIPAGPAIIHVTYTGILNDKLRGFYRSEANGRKYAVTQMEATDARRAFPSFDEPIYKATFEISLMIDNGDTAISNGAQVSDTPGPEPGKHTLRFARTKKMSTYLVAMIVGDFVCRGGTADNTPLRVCSTPDKRGLTGYALEAAEQQLNSSMPTLASRTRSASSTSSPSRTLPPGAMENVGAITFRERLLLIDAERASLRRAKAGRRNPLARDRAHVVRQSRDDEMVGRYLAERRVRNLVENKPVAVWRPEWNVHLDDAAATQSALGLDALRSTRPIRTKVETPAEINEVFDGIAYEKSAAVLRMVEGFVGADAFRKGITRI